MSEKLAIDGGTPILQRSDFGNWPVITEDDRKFVNAVLDSGIVAGGTAPQVSALEKEWAAYTGSNYCLTTCSGTAALHMALASAGVGPGDEVITSAFTFLASATSDASALTTSRTFAAAKVDYSIPMMKTSSTRPLWFDASAMKWMR